MRSIAIYNTYLTRSIALLTAFCTISAFLYGIFLLMAVAHTATRTTAERQVTAISAHLGDMEGQYLTQQKSMTMERAKELGYVQPEKVSTVPSTAATRTLTINANR